MDVFDRSRRGTWYYPGHLAFTLTSSRKQLINQTSPPLKVFVYHKKTETRYYSHIKTNL